MSVPEAVLADSAGSLVTDRYAAYNRFRGRRGYCLEHLRRDTPETVGKNPGSAECAAFADALVPWLREAMSLRSACAGDPAAYLVRAAFIRRRIEAVAEAPARQPSSALSLSTTRPWVMDPVTGIAAASGTKAL